LEANNSATCYLYCVGKHRIIGTFTISFELEGKTFESWEVFEEARGPPAAPRRTYVPSVFAVGNSRNSMIVKWAEGRKTEIVFYLLLRNDNDKMLGSQTANNTHCSTVRLYSPV
jgi:hypothetical protein